MADHDRALTEWSDALGADERAQLRAIAVALAKDAGAAAELETWLVLGYAAVHAWACAEQHVAELKERSEDRPHQRERAR